MYQTSYTPRSFAGYYNTRITLSVDAYKCRGVLVLHMQPQIDMLTFYVKAKKMKCSWYHKLKLNNRLFKRVLERLGFTPPFVRRASYFCTNLSEDCYFPSRVLQD
jgi:hypothetical protein